MTNVITKIIINFYTSGIGSGSVLGLRGKEKRFEMTGTIVDGITNEEGKSKVFRAGSSDAVSIPAKWQILLGMKDCPVEKHLLRVQVPHKKLGPLKITSLEIPVLLITPEGFPIKAIEKKE